MRRMLTIGLVLAACLGSFLVGSMYRPPTAEAAAEREGHWRPPISGREQGLWLKGGNSFLSVFQDPDKEACAITMGSMKRPDRTYFGIVSLNDEPYFQIWDAEREKYRFVPTKKLLLLLE